MCCEEEGGQLERTDVVGPFELERHVLVARVVAFDAFDYGERGEVLDEYYGSLRCDGHGVSDAGREH